MSDLFPTPDEVYSAPTAEGFFGPYGGRFVPETVMPALLELTEAFEAAIGDASFQQEFDATPGRLRGAAHAAVSGATPCRGHGPGGGLSQARGPLPHRRAQDQQHHRAVSARGTHGQEARDRRDRRRSARCRDRHRGGADGPRMRGVHGRRGHPTPGAQRLQDAPAGRRGHPGRRGFGHARRRGDGGSATLGGAGRGHLLRAWQRRGAASVSDDGTRVPERDRTRDHRRRHHNTTCHRKSTPL